MIVFSLMRIYSNNQGAALSVKKKRFFSDMTAGDDDSKWFREINPGFWPGQAFALEIDKVLYHEKSKYQDVLVFKRLIIHSLIILSIRDLYF
jgi:hypothetical protein